MSEGASRWRSERAGTYATRLMGALFGVGAVCFVIGPLVAYGKWVGAHGDALTFFIGSILFTGGGLTQCWLAWPERRDHRSGALAWHAAWIQSVGTVLFNVMTYKAITLGPSDHHYDALVWIPNAVGSVCFLVSGALLYLSAPREGWMPRRRAPGWWEPLVNLLGCVLFGISAITGLAISNPGHELNLTTANWTTTFGAVCFLALAIAAAIIGMTFRVPRFNRLIAFEHALAHELDETFEELGDDARRLAHAAAHEVGEDLDSVGRLIRGDAPDAQLD